MNVLAKCIQLYHTRKEKRLLDSQESIKQYELDMKRIAGYEKGRRFNRDKEKYGY